MSISDDLARIALQERSLQFPFFDEDAAWRLGSRLRSLAVERGLGIVIDIRRPAQPLFFAALGGTTPDNAEWVRRKSNVVFRFHRSSLAIGLDLEQRQTSMQERWGLAAADYASHGGSFPILVAKTGCIGAVTVSGLAQRDDHNLAVEGLAAELGQDFGALRLP